MKTQGAAKSRRPSQRRTSERDTLNEIGELCTRLGAVLRRQAALGARLPSPLGDMARLALQEFAPTLSHLEQVTTAREALARR